MTKPDALERELFEAYVASKYPGVNLTIRSDGQYWESTPDSFLEFWVAGRKSVSAIPAGWQLVPIEPTAEMIAQGEEPWPRNKNSVFGAPVLSTSYAAMLKAAPAPPQGVSL